jgi:hypothetical protein
VKLVRFRTAAAAVAHPGVLVQDGIVDVADAAPTMKFLIDHFDELRGTLDRFARDNKPIPLEDVPQRPPRARPDKIMCCIANYWEHAQREPRPGS